MLTQLIRYARAHDLVAEPGFAPKSAQSALQFTCEGRWLDLLPLGGADKSNRERAFPCCPDLTQPELVSGAEERCHFLIETAQVVALLMKGDEDDKAQARARGKHAFFTQLLRAAAEALPHLAPIAATLDTPDTLAAIQAAMQRHKVKPTDKVTIAIDDAFPVESEAWHDWWRMFRRRLNGAEEDPGHSKGTPDAQMRCLASGALAAPLATHPKISGLSDVGGLGTGDALICFDKEAFRSYGLEQSSNAAVSEQAASMYRAALNQLIQRHGTRLTGAKVVHWYDRSIPVEDDFQLDLETPRVIEEKNAQERARRLLESIRKGERPDLLGCRYFAMTLSGASGRVMVRDWMEGQFEQLVHNIVAWFDDLSIVSRDGQGCAPPPKFFAVMGAVTRDLKTVPPPFIAQMWHVAVTNGAIPTQAMAQTLARVRVDIIQDAPASHARMGLLKAYLIRRSQGGIPMSPYLNEDHPAPAYHCGRLMAVLARVQRAALGDVGAGVVQRFYAAASATPALILGRLTRTSQFHLNKLDGGLAYWYEQQLGGIWAQLGNHVPRTLTLEEQSLFALGYYQQLAALRAPASTKVESTSDTTTTEEK